MRRKSIACRCAGANIVCERDVKTKNNTGSVLAHSVKEPAVATATQGKLIT